MHKVKLLLLALALPLLALTNTQPVSAACVVSLTINDIPHQACKGFDEHEDALAALDIPGFSYDKESHTITLNGFNGTIVGENLGSGTQTLIQDILPAIIITGDSVINNVAFQASATTTPTEAIDTTNDADTNQTLCTKPASIFSQIASMPLVFALWSLVIIILTTAVT